MLWSGCCYFDAVILLKKVKAEALDTTRFSKRLYLQPHP